MIDIHTHILPRMDDGSRSLEETVALLRLLDAQDITTVCATPHFYAHKEYPEDFFRRREQAIARLEPIQDMFPKMDLLFGAEVYYYPSIRSSDLMPFTISDTGLLLLEMPFTKWNRQMIQDVRELNRHYRVVLAHIERYMDDNRLNVFKKLADEGVQLQINASSLTREKNLKKILKLIRDDDITYLATDTHNIKYRPPMMDQAREVIIDRLGTETWKHLVRKQQDNLYP